MTTESNDNPTLIPCAVVPAGWAARMAENYERVNTPRAGRWFALGLSASGIMLGAAVALMIGGV